MKTFLAIMFLFTATIVNAQKLEKLWSTSKDLRTPESVLYVNALNIAFAANMGDSLDKKTGDGFISQIDLTGKITNLKWVTGLNDPKGMAVLNGKLYVADMDELVEIDIDKATILKHYPAPGSKFLNDVTASSDGVVYVSDMKDQRIYALIDGVFSSWLYNEKLNYVNGLWVEGSILYAGNNSVWQIDIKTKEMTALINETGGIDGLETIGNGNFIFSNWGGKIYVSDNGKVIKLLDTTAEKRNSADIDYIPEQKIVLVPTFFGNNVDAYKLEW